MDTEKEIKSIMINLEKMSGMDRQSLQAAIDKEVAEAYGIPEEVADTLDGKDMTTPVTSKNARPRETNRSRKNNAPYPQEPYLNEPCKPSFADLVVYLINNSPIICIGERLYLYQYIAGYYKALSLDDDTFQRYVLGFCPFWFKREYHTNMNGKIYSDLVVFLQKFSRDKCFNDEDIEFTRRNYILTSDSIYEIDTGKIQKGFTEEIPFARKGLGIWLAPLYEEQKDLQYRRYFDTFLENISDSSSQIKSIFKGFLGCLFANSEYNAKKIVILYGHTTTIRAIVKFLEKCLNKDSISHIPLDKLTDKYALREIERKSVNISFHTDSRTLIRELGGIIELLSGEYIYSENKIDKCTILNDKCYILCTDESLDLKALIGSVESLNGVLLIPIGKAVNKIKDINDKLRQLSIVSGIIFLEAMKAREALEDNDWQFETLPEIEEALVSAKEKQAEQESDELQSFIGFLDEYCDFLKNGKVKKADLISCCKNYCERNNRATFENKIIIEGIRKKVCEVLHITPEKFNEIYKSGNGKNITINGVQVRGFNGICLKKPPKK